MPALFYWWEPEHRIDARFIRVELEETAYFANGTRTGVTEAWVPPRAPVDFLFGAMHKAASTRRLAPGDTAPLELVHNLQFDDAEIRALARVKVRARRARSLRRATAGRAQGELSLRVDEDIDLQRL